MSIAFDKRIGSDTISTDLFIALINITSCSYRKLIWQDIYFKERQKKYVDIADNCRQIENKCRHKGAIDEKRKITQTDTGGI